MIFIFSNAFLSSSVKSSPVQFAVFQVQRTRHLAFLCIFPKHRTFSTQISSEHFLTDSLFHSVQTLRKYFFNAFQIPCETESQFGENLGNILRTLIMGQKNSYCGRRSDIREQGSAPLMNIILMFLPCF